MRTRELRTREPASSWQENVIAAIILLGGNKLSNVRSFNHFGSGEGLTSFNKDKSANFFEKKKYNEAFRGIYFLFESTRKNFKSNLVHVVILLLESQRSLMSYVVRETSFQMFLSFIGEIGERPQSP